MGLSAPLSLGNLDIAYPNRPSTFPSTSFQQQPVILPGVPSQTYAPGVGLFEGPVSGNAESVTGAVNAPGTPGSPGGAVGAPSAPGATNAGVPGTVGTTQGGMLADISNVMSSINSQTPAAQLGGMIGVNPTISNTVVGLAGLLTGFPLGIANTIGGVAAGKPDVTEETTQGLGKVAGWFDQFLDPADNATPGGPVGGAVGVGPGGAISTADTDQNDGGQGGSQGPADGPAGGAVGVGEGGAISTSPTDANDGGTGGSDGSDTVICTELHRQGYLTGELWEADQEFGRRVPADVRRGYLAWATVVVCGMQKSPTFTRVVWTVARPWTEFMAGRPSLIGRIEMAVGWRVCAWLGNTLRARVATT